MDVKRTVVLDNANNWLQDKTIDAIITSLPDAEEIGFNIESWKGWIERTCGELINALSEKSIIIFYQTDRKYKGTIIDKKTLISKVFLSAGFNNVFSKIVLKQVPETISVYRPGYTNMFGFSKYLNTGITTPDVIFAGEMIYKNAMGLNACQAAVKFIKSKGITDTIHDPFCGQGSVLKIANDLGFHSVGVDIDPKQTNIARNL